MSEALRLTRVEYVNIGPYDKATLDLDKVTVVRSKNGLGKSTLCDGILSLLSAPDNELVKDECAIGYITGYLNNGMRIARTLSRDGGTSLEVYNPDGTKRERAKEFVKGLCDLRALNPVKFLSANPKDQIDWLLQALDLRFTPEQEAEFLKLNNDRPLLERDLLTYIDTTRELVYNRRTTAHGAKENIAGHIAKLYELVPFEFDPSLERPEVASLNSEHTALVNEYSGKTSAIKQSFERERNARRNQSTETVKQKTADTQILISRAEKEAQDKIDAINEQLRKDLKVLNDGVVEFTVASGKEADEEIAKLQNTYEFEIQDLKEEFEPKIAAKKAQATAAHDEDLAFERNVANFNNLVNAKEELEVKDAEWQKLQDSMAWIDAAKVEIMKGLPLGLEIRGGAVYCDNIIWRRVNTAKKLQIAIQLADARAGALKLGVFDNAESLDPDNTQLSIQYCRRANCSFVIFIVTGDPEFSIEQFTAVSADTPLENLPGEVGILEQQPQPELELEEAR
jgi:hypothetical protein